jgi:hypothetical protein
MCTRVSRYLHTRARLNKSMCATAIIFEILAYALRQTEGLRHGRGCGEAVVRHGRGCGEAQLTAKERGVGATIKRDDVTEIINGRRSIPF